ncbi:hypothetical protein PAXINDRAFT_172862 [Paxillus involutus ATCC 200175]|uniref:Unplaced genomic scaffold PAXINscaffold_265, whole genome shotgun sequence n=1 Tax=Paxillus involutus ATCC 200175 TaxID=664439 RepID=A0A0C9SP16_PAXIN|nr:hypothetical protein PAXINDRAFT_172862 [Paxillus involutus ATCC 200175]
MASQPRQPLPRLSIPPSLNMQQPYDGRQAMFSPGLPTSLQQSYHPPPFQIVPPQFQIAPQPLQTPMQTFFPQQPPNAPGRPTYPHHKGHASMAHFPGFPPQSAIPITPLGQGFPMMVPAFGQPFVPRNRRTPSVSIGGPPKAPLGGPGRRHSPLPPPPPPQPPAVQKGKKIVVNLPVETISGTEDQPPARPPWARTPMPRASHEEPEVAPPAITSAEPYPPDAWRYHVPNTVDVFLPGKVAWDALKHRVIEEKLEKLGVERGSGGSLPLHAPHARAASISSPADPSLLYFKLNKLQQSQNASASNSLSSSPPLFNLTPSPGSQGPPRLQNRHGHSFSLAHPPPPIHTAFYNPTAAFNPFGASAILGSDSIEEDAEPHVLAPMQGIHAPQGRVPMSIPALAPPSISRGSSRPDFVRGFGLDIPEEEEPEEEARLDADVEQNPGNNGDGVASTDSQGSTELDGMTTAAQSRYHSRHVSRLSFALSLRSVGGLHDEAMPEEVDIVPIRSPVGDPIIDDLDKEAVGEWTGSEDLRLDDADDEESIGEWSNPSDEERARQDRMQRRLLRQRKQEIETPRRLPNFPVPPTNVFGMPIRRDYDLVSNPSEDGLHAEQRAAFLGVDPLDFPLGPSSTSTPGRRPLPPLPHSRGHSGQFTAHDPALAHSRVGSDQTHLEQHVASIIPSSSSGTLNPHAKPFVFGVNRGSGSWGSFADVLPPPAITLGHTRLPSFGKPLNATAQEFKPTGFTFRPPPGVPQFNIPVPEPSRPLPTPPVKSSPTRVQQGREKRQRRGSGTTTTDDGDHDSGKENMASFRFPPLGDTPGSIRRSAPTSPRVSGSQDFHVGGGPLQPLTFSGFPTVPLPRAEEPEEMVLVADQEEDLPENRAKGPENDENQIPKVPPARQRRAPIPLDFKNPTSSNTVPAGVFKALVGDEKTRRTVRSRLDSREIFEHSQRPSLDDLAVPPIAMSSIRSRTRLVTDPGFKREGFGSPDIFTPAIRRRSSLPALHSAHNSSLSNVSIPAINLTKRLEAQALEDKIEAMLDQKFHILCSELVKSRESAVGASISPGTEDAITEVVTLFRTQLQESAARGLDDSQMDARGELDLELIRDVVQQGHAESLLILQTELCEALSRIEQARQAAPVPSNSLDIVPVIDQISRHNLQVILNTLGQLSNKVDLRSRPFADQYERDSLIEEIVIALNPCLNALRPEPVDYDVLTARLSQAVKPNIEQLIDLAADKRETAGLIVESLLPLLPKPSSTLDTNTITAQIASEIRKVIGPIDAHEIKEQVADLVVERLDSRLAVRDKAFNVDVVSGKVTESMSGLLQSVNDVVPKLDSLVEFQSSLAAKNDDLVLKHAHLAGLVSSLPSRFEELKLAVESAKELSLQPSQPTSTENNEAVLSALHLLQSTVEVIASGQNSKLAQKDELIALQEALHQELRDRLNALPESLSAAVNVMQTTHAEFATSRDAAKYDAEEIRKLKAANNEFQVQLAKARGAHGQVRVEKDTLGDRLKDVESDRERLRVQVEELQASINTQASELSAVELRNSELEDALSQSLARLKTSDVAAQSNQERIAELEKSNKEAAAEQQDLKDQLGDVQLQAKMATHERELIAQSLKLLQQQHESLIAQQSHWEDLHRVAEQIEALTNLRSQTNEEEIRELRHARDQHRQLESEHTALQKRVRDQELRVTNNERAVNAAKHSLVQAQQRASEWERRAREYEGDLEITRNKLDEVEQAQLQLDADYSLVKLQLEEKEAEDRLVKDRENKLRDQVSSLGAQVARLEAQLSKVKAQTPSSDLPSYNKPAPTKNTSPPRPDSRASTVAGGDRSHTPVGRVNGSQQPRSDTPPQSSVWQSRHAPKLYPTPGSAVSYGRRSTASYRPQSVASMYRPQSVASPTPSTVSLTPTVDENGWWT